MPGRGLGPRAAARHSHGARPDMAASGSPRRSAGQQPGRHGAAPRRVAAAGGGQARPGGAGPARRPRRRADPARRTAYDVLHRGGPSATPTPTCCSRRCSAERGLAGPGRGAGHRADLRHAARPAAPTTPILGLCSDRALDRVDPPLREVLRLGTHQLLGHPGRRRTPPWPPRWTWPGTLAGPRSAGFVNAVLRRVVHPRPGKPGSAIAAPAARRGPARAPGGPLQPPALARRRRSRAALGEDAGRPRCRETEAALAADGDAAAGHPVRGARAGRPAELLAGGRGAGPVVAVRRLPRLRATRPGIAAVAEGRAAVQDEASQLAARARSARAGLDGRDTRWLDMCAGPGRRGRTAGRPGRRARRAPAGRRRAAAPRPAGPGRGRHHRCRRGGSGRRHPPGLGGRHRRPGPGRRSVLGNRGVRRRPEARWRKSLEDVLALGGLQRRLLGSALDAARPGGVVAYVTCSPHLAETRDVLADVLGARDDTEVLDAPGVLAEVGTALPGTRRPVRAVLAAPARQRRDLPGPAAPPLSRPAGGGGRATGCR